LYSSSSASVSEAVAVTSMFAICETIAMVFAACALLPVKYVLTRFFRLRALPTYSTSPFSAIMRYTPGRWLRFARKGFWSKALMGALF
jgi:hypothetical protein